MYVLSDFTTSVHRALKEIDPNYLDYPGVAICGSHTPTNPEELIYHIACARTTRTPILAICYGHQLTAIEYARNILDIEDATSEEWGKGTFVVKKRPELKVGWKEGETWWTNYDVDFETFPALKGMYGQGVWSVPYHPEYQSWKGHPHPILVEYIEYAKTKQ